MAKVSVIIPNYNHGAYLKQRIDSVLNQTYGDFEVIILDDCSSDNSKDVIEQYRHHKKVNKIIYNTENSGSTFKQWDKGIKLAEGDYVWIAESDDWCETNLLETLVTGIQKKNDCVLAYCQSYCIVDDNSVKFLSGHSKLEDFIDGKTFIKDYALIRNPIFNAGMAIWKREAYNKISKDYIRFKIIGDFYFWIELCTCGSVFISGKLLNYFRTHEKNVSLNAFQNGQLYIEQVPLLKHLVKREIINEADYAKTLKPLYISFRGLEKKMPKANADIVRNLFSANSNLYYSMRIVFFKQKMLSLLKRKLRW